MKRIIAGAGMVLVLAACAPVLSRDLMREGALNVPMEQLRQSPEASLGKLYILGGLIVDTKFTDKGSQIEAVYVPVDSSGYLNEGGHSQGRFLAVYPRSKGLLDPLVYKKGREVTIAGVLTETRKSKIDEMEYTYPVFEIREIYLWPEYQNYPYPPYYYYPYYPFYYNSPFLYDRWGRPYPNPYWPPPPW